MRRIVFGIVVLFAAATTMAAPKSELGEPVRLESDGKKIDVDVGHAAPFFGDFDGDGKADLLVGQFGEGKLRFYRNIGTKSQPKFAGLKWFRAGDGLGKVPTG